MWGMEGEGWTGRGTGSGSGLPCSPTLRVHRRWQHCQLLSGQVTGRRPLLEGEPGQREPILVWQAHGCASDSQSRKAPSPQVTGENSGQRGIRTQEQDRAQGCSQDLSPWLADP